MRKLKNKELQRISIEEFKHSEKLPLIIILDNVRSMYNVGSIFRTADAFRAEKIFLCGITGTPPHREIEKTALGSTKSVEWEYRKDTSQLIHELKKSDYKIFAFEHTTKSIPLYNLEISEEEKYVLIFGNEVSGISDGVLSHADSILEIPQFGIKHSLNVSITSGIVLWHFHNFFSR